MSPRGCVLEELDVSIDEKRLENRFKTLLRSRHLPDFVRKKAEKGLDDARPAPRGIYAFFEAGIDELKKTVRIDAQIMHSGFLVERFTGAAELGLFIVTIGPDIEERTWQAIRKRDNVMALIYDAIGSEYVESTADALHGLLEREKGYPMARYSPGYNDWDIAEQRKLFALVDGSAIGVTLNESCLMTPQKSVSAIIGRTVAR